jgi:hypothetical protein
MQGVVKVIAAVVMCLLVPDGNTILAGGYRDGNGAGTEWVFTCILLSNDSLT